uniref:Transcription elongation factor SPT4 n=1 Tax=Astatotilapia calliptera TaxID=8154 RepID=A0AAX7TP67_ASTCA
MALETVPKDLRHLRACLLCSLVKTIDQFEYDGCDNCESYLQMKGNREMVYECTSSSFDGVIAMMSPEDSWVAKWQRIGNFKPGVYAVSVTGRLPPGTFKHIRAHTLVGIVFSLHMFRLLIILFSEGVVRELKSRGVIYKSRDTAVKT